MGSGFGFVTFDPEFEKNGKFYTVHTEKFAGLSTKPTTYPSQPNTFLHGVVTEWTADNPDANTFHGTSREILRLGFALADPRHPADRLQPHRGKRDGDYGLLYLAVGDGGIGVGTDVPQELGTPTARSCGSTPTAPTARTGSTASRLEPVRRRTRARSARSTRSACATRTGSRGTPVASTACTSATSASTRSRRVYEVRAG